MLFRSKIMGKLNIRRTGDSIEDIEILQKEAAGMAKAFTNKLVNRFVLLCTQALGPDTDQVVAEYQLRQYANHFFYTKLERVFTDRIQAITQQFASPKAVDHTGQVISN